MRQLERASAVRLTWLPGETGHPLSAVTLNPERAGDLFVLLNRTPLAARRAKLADLSLGERFRFGDRQLRAIQRSLDQLKEEMSPSPFSMTDEAFNGDLLFAMAALDGVREETPYRVFSTRGFNDSKRFEVLMRALVVLVRRSQPGWRALTNDDELRELNLTANPSRLFLHGVWQLVDDLGQVLSLGEFEPSAGVPAAGMRQVDVGAASVLCIENAMTCCELVRHDPAVTAICLWGNPSPARRHLLSCLPQAVAVYRWADIDYGGLNILSQLRQRISPRVQPYRMDIETFEAHAAWARPLTPIDARKLARLAQGIRMQSVLAQDFADRRIRIARLSTHVQLALRRHAQRGLCFRHAVVLPWSCTPGRPPLRRGGSPRRVLAGAAASECLAPREVAFSLAQTGCRKATASSLTERTVEFAKAS